MVNLELDELDENALLFAIGCARANMHPQYDALHLERLRGIMRRIGEQHISDYQLVEDSAAAAAR